MQVRFKKLHDDAVMPKFGNPGDAGADLTAISVKFDPDTGTYEYGTGIAIEIPENYVGLIFPRSSVFKTGMLLSNCVGVIDSGYRGEIRFKFHHVNSSKIKYNAGDRVGQIILMRIPNVDYVEVSDLNESIRGKRGFGSTGK